jgi:hypothetical protein
MMSIRGKNSDVRLKQAQTESTDIDSPATEDAKGVHHNTIRKPEPLSTMNAGNLQMSLVLSLSARM